MKDITKKYSNTYYKLLSQAVNQSPTSILITDTTGEIKYVNPKFCEMTGYTFEECLGKNPRILKSELTPPALYQQLWDRIIAGKEWRGEFINKKKNGDLYYECTSIAPIVDDQENILYFVAVKEDITSRKKKELELLISEKRFRMIAENLGDVIWIYSLSSNKFSYVSPSASSLRGYSPEDVLSQSMKDILTPESYQYVLEELPKRVAEFNAGDMSTKIRTDNLDEVHKNGKIVKVEVVTTILADQNGKAASILGMSRDITRRKLVEESLRNANQELKLYIQTIEKLRDELLHQAITDSLTGLYNRHFMQEVLKREIARAERKKQNLSLIMLDIDHFKEINDTYGHAAGDQILQALAKLLKSCSREYDYVFRYGGDEFLIILSEIDSESINKFGERIRKGFESLVVPYKDYKIQSTVSIGILLQTNNYADELLISRVDKALYNAKQMGRNRVSKYGEAS